MGQRGHVKSKELCILYGKGNSVANGRIILRWIFRKWDVRVWTGLIWLRIRTGGRLL